MVMGASSFDRRKKKHTLFIAQWNQAVSMNVIAINMALPAA